MDSVEIIDLTSDSDDIIIEVLNPSITNGNKENLKGLNGLDRSGINGFSKNTSRTAEAGGSRSRSQNKNKVKVSNVCSSAVAKLLAIVGQSPMVKPLEKERIAAKMDKRIDSLIKKTVFTEEVEKVLMAKIEKASANISANNRAVWKELEKLFATMENASATDADASSMKSSNHDHEPPNPISDTDAKFRTKIIKLEKKLMTLEQKINEWDKRDVDFEDDLNSSYLVKTRMVNYYMKHYTMLCDLQDLCKVNTGRAIHKRLRFEDITKYPEINTAIFKHLNAKTAENSYYFPDFHDVLKVVKGVRDENSLLLSDYEIGELAKEIFENIASILKKRRNKDFCLAMNLDSVEDPADNDSELSKKLEENRLRGKKEDDVIREFVEKQGETKAAEVIDEDPDLSPVGSDSETDFDEEGDNESDLDEDEVLSVSGDEQAELDLEITKDKQDKEIDISSSSSETDFDDTDQKSKDAKKPRLDLIT